MSVETSYFAVGRNNTAYKVLGSELSSILESGDVLLMQRGDDRFKFTISDPVDVSSVLDTDLFICTDTLDNTTYKITGALFKGLFDEPEFDREGYDKCVQAARTAKTQCYLLCETDYCKSICEREFEASIEDCKIDFHWKPPTINI